jgi:hypothetical protein
MKTKSRYLNKGKYRMRRNKKTKNIKRIKKMKQTSLPLHHTKTKKLNCSPKSKNEINDFSCYSKTSLYKLRDIWNARHPDTKIITNDPKEIHAKLTSLLSGLCNIESCWIKQHTAFGKVPTEITQSFAPKMPTEWKKNPNEWLSSMDIINVMNQYERTYKCFEFIGPSPIDFDTKKLYGECVWDELCNLSIENQIKKGKTKIGIIFNTDTHNNSGEHWVSMFINIKKQTIFFFDSTGDNPQKEITVLVKRIKDQGLKLNPPIHFKYDSNEGVDHQRGNTECGVYSLFFIVHLLEDKLTEQYLKTHRLNDKYMEQFRKIYFNEEL